MNAGNRRCQHALNGDRVKGRIMGQAERRVAPRAKIFQPAELVRGDPHGPSERVHLLNLSTSGALVYGRSAIEAGARVHLTCGFSFGAARVTWSNGQRFGVQFDVPLSELQIAAVLHTQEMMVERFHRRMELAALAEPPAGDQMPLLAIRSTSVPPSSRVVK